MGLGVLPLPLGTLLLVAVQPVVRLGVEALGVLVVAFVVVVGSHAVQRRVEVLGHVLGRVALVRLLQREGDTTTLQVDVDDLDHGVRADLDNLLRHLHVTLGQLGDVHQALDPVVDPDERTERHQLGDLAGDDLPDLMGPSELLPRVFERRLQRERDPLPVHVDVENLDRDLLAHLDDLGRVVDVLPGQLGHVHQAVDTAEIDERTEVDDRGDDTRTDLSLLQRLQEGGTDLGLSLLEPRTAGQDHIVAVLVQLDDLGFDLLADIRLEVAHPAHLHERRRQEAPQADVEDQAALDDLDDRTGHDAVGFLDLLDLAPRALVLRTLLGQDQPAFLVLLLQDQSFDIVADGNNLVWINVVFDRQLTRGDNALCLIADVEQDLVPVDLDDGTGHQVAVIKVLDGLVDRGEKGLRGPDVIDRHLRRCRRACGGCFGLDAARHVEAGSGQV